MATTRLTRTQTAGTRTKGTLSTWVKRGDLSEDTLYTQFADGTNFTRFRFSSNTINANDRTGGGDNWYFTTNAVYRDPSAWYHVVISIDTTQSTDTNRLRCWVNGVLQTFTSQAYPTEDANMNMNQTGQTSQIGANELTADYFDGVMAHTHWTDGYSYAATDFGETDATSGIWVPISAPSVTYGTNGFFLKFASGAFGTDSSGESNDFVVTGTMTATKDNAMDNYCTWNSVGNVRISGGTAYPATFSNSNTTALNAHATYHTGCMGTMGTKKGKWYYECKCSDVGGIDYIGYAGEDDWGNLLNTYTYANDGTIDDVAYGDTYTSGDIISVAFDADNGTIWFGKNGTWQNGASEAEIEAGTDTNAAVTSIDMTKYYLLAQKGFQDATNQLNTGNGYFGTTAITSAGTNAGSGLFEYDVPSGYYAFNTNNLATYG